MGRRLPPSGALRACRFETSLCRRRAFTLIELIVVIAVAAILCALMFAGFRMATRSSKQAQSVANLRAIAQGFSGFLADNNMRYPGSGGTFARARWLHRVAPYMGFEPLRTYRFPTGESAPIYWDAYFHPAFRAPLTDKKIYVAPASMNGIGVYGINPEIIKGSAAWGISAAAIASPAKTVLLAERFAGVGGPSGCELKLAAPYPKELWGVAANYGDPAADPEGAGPALLLFADGHTDILRLESLRPWPGVAGEVGGVRFKPGY
jgi:prepilin-type N-terminal cleavage/methylation domain-containing protein